MSVELQPKTIDWQSLPEDTGVREHRWTREEYYRAHNAGVFGPEERLELIQGVVYEKYERLAMGDECRMTAQGNPRYTCIRATTKTMERAFGSDCEIRTQAPLDAGRRSDPEPDVLVVRGSYLDYAQRAPAPGDVLLLVEVSDTTLRFDLGRKAALYAETGVSDYWVVSLNERRLYIHREPVALLDSPSGFGYQSIVRYEDSESVSPLVAPQARIMVADLLPPVVRE